MDSFFCQKQTTGENNRSADYIAHTLRRMSMCPAVPSRLRIMYLGAEWRRNT